MYVLLPRSLTPKLVQPKMEFLAFELFDELPWRQVSESAVKLVARCLPSSIAILLFVPYASDLPPLNRSGTGVLENVIQQAENSICNGGIRWL
jgi:hypothetical protein